MKAEMYDVMGTFSFYFEQAGHLDSSIIAECTEIFLVFLCMAIFIT